MIEDMNELELLKIIRESDDPVKALVIAMELIDECLRDPEAFERQAHAYLQGKRAPTFDASAT